MIRLGGVCLALLVVVSVAASNEETELFSCLFDTHTLDCAKKNTDAAMDRIETEVMGNNNTVAFSKVIEQSGSLLVDAVFRSDDAADNDSPAESKSSGVREARKKKFGKKKFKLLRKLLPIFSLFQAKISLILRLISTHIQMKFFVVAVIGLLVNVARFWLDLKRQKDPGQVIYYGHAQHQHHYEPEHEHEPDYWKRSLESEDIASGGRQAYSAWAPSH